MQKLMLRQAVVLVALLASSASMAATVTITASTLTPTVGSNFTMTITSDVQNTFAATMALAFDATKVAYVSGAALAPWTIFVKNSPPSENPTGFTVETQDAQFGPTYNVAVLTFQVLANAADGPAGIVIDDDGGNASGWASSTAEWIPVSYTQANVQVVPAPAAVWLLATGLAGLGGRRWLRRKISG